MPFEVVLDATRLQVMLVTGKGALSTWRSCCGQRRKPEEPRFWTSREVNRMQWGVCERELKPQASWKGLSGKAKAKTGIGKSDLPGL
jgi:hypothetical protein